MSQQAGNFCVKEQSSKEVYFIYSMTKLKLNYIFPGLGTAHELSDVGHSGETAGGLLGELSPQTDIPEMPKVPHIPEGIDWFSDISSNNGESNNEVRRYAMCSNSCCEPR